MGLIVLTLCVCPSVTTLKDEQMDIHTQFLLHVGSMSGSGWNVKVRGQRSRPAKNIYQSFSHSNAYIYEDTWRYGVVCFKTCVLSFEELDQSNVYLMQSDSKSHSNFMVITKFFRPHDRTKPQGPNEWLDIIRTWWIYNLCRSMWIYKTRLLVLIPMPINKDIESHFGSTSVIWLI